MDFTGERFIPGTGSQEMYVEHIQRYYFAKQFVDGKVVLDAACGEGYGSYILSDGASQIYGIDISEEAIVNAKDKYKKDNISYYIESIDNMTSIKDNTIDVVVSFETIEHVSEDIQAKFLMEIKRVLKMDGILIMSTPNKAIYSDLYNFKNNFHIKEFYVEEYKQFLNNYFKHNIYLEQFFETSNLIVSKDSQLANIKNNKKENQMKYIISISSNEAYKYQIKANVLIDEEDDYKNKIDRIITLQYEQEERNRHIKNLDNEIFKLSNVIKSERADYEKIKTVIDGLKEEIDSKNKELIDKQEEIENKNKELIDKQEEIENKNKELIDKQEEIENKNREFSDSREKLKISDEKISYLETELNNKNGHIELLLKSDRELSNIKSRWRWKIVNFPFYATKKIAKILLPKGSKGYLFAKLFMNSIRNPRLYLSKLNFTNIKKLRRMMSNEGTQMTIEKLEQFNEFNTKINEHEKIEVLDIKNINFDEIIVPYFSDITVSIIIPVYNQFKYTYNCIKSIVENTTDISYEIIIVDDVSSDKTVDINNIIKNILIIRNERNLGFLLNCNNASKKARGKYFYFLNNDTNIQKNTIVKLIDTFNNFEKVGLVGSKLVYPDGKLQEAGGIFWNDASAWNYGNRVDAEMPEYNYVKEVDYVSGASMIIPKDIWEDIGGFDERYVPAYCEDSDFAFEVRQKGYKVMYQPKSVVVHFEGISNGTDTNTGIKAYQVENQKKLFEKWNNVLQKEHYVNGENVFKARDRSFNKKTILVIDHYVPHYDKDAGSRTVFQYLKLFVKMGLNVKFIGDNYFKHEPYTSDLQEMGIEVLYGDYYANNWKEWIKVNSKYIDYVFLNRPHIAEKYIDYVKENTKAKIFYYGHDLHFLREKREYELTKNEELVNGYQQTMNDEFSIMRKSDFVYYPSFVEVEEIKKHDSSINAKAIQAYMYDDIKYSQYNMKNRKDLLFVGGFGHKPNVDAILWFAKKVFPKIIKNYPEIKLNIVGSNPTQDIKNLKSENINVVGYVSDEKLEKFYLETRIVVVPLRYGAGIKGKVIEAMIKGVPIVTTSVGVEGLKNIENMFSICDNADDFANSIIKYYSNEEILRNTSDKYYDYIRKYFSSEHAFNIIKDDFS